jgi:hypothetical protein
MRTFLFYLIISVSVIACTENHFHDGGYKATIFTDGSMSWVNDEVIELDGNFITIKFISVVNKSILSEYKKTCKQYQDRIEYRNKDGIDFVVRFDEQGNMKYGEYVYKRINSKGTNP